MGVDAGDLDANGTEDIFVTHLMDETNTLFTNLGKAVFEDRTREAGLGCPDTVSPASAHCSSIMTTMAGLICSSQMARCNCCLNWYRREFPFHWSTESAFS